MENKIQRHGRSQGFRTYITRHEKEAIEFRDYWMFAGGITTLQSIQTMIGTIYKITLQQ
jgi:hypothetical protein